MMLTMGARTRNTYSQDANKLRARMGSHKNDFTVLSILFVLAWEVVAPNRCDVLQVRIDELKTLDC